MNHFEWKGWVIRPLVIVLIFLAMQVFCALPVAFLSVSETKASSAMISLTLIVSSVMTIWVLHLLHFFHLRHIVDMKTHYGYALMGIVAALFGIFAFNALSEFFSLEDNLKEEMAGMAHSSLGVVALVFIGPLCEEIVFRGAVFHSMLKGGMSPWLAITASAFLFALIHLNPAQIPYAFIMGTILAILAYYSESILPSLVVHVINNGYAVAVLRYADTDTSFRDMLGGWCLPLMLAALAACVFLLILFAVKATKFK